MIRETTEMAMDEGRGTVAAPHRAACPSLEQCGILVSYLTPPVSLRGGLLSSHFPERQAQGGQLA